jgi:DNA-binding MarR family transcriptional regulator
MISSDSTLPNLLRAWVEVFMHNSFRDLRRFMEEAGLSHSQVGALMRLYHQEACGVSGIGEHLGITVAAASQLVDRLVQQGFLARTEDPGDRRFKQVSLTPKGKAFIENGIRYRQQWMEKLTHALTPEEQETVSEALSLLIRAAVLLDPDTHDERGRDKSFEPLKENSTIV